MTEVVRYADAPALADAVARRLIDRLAAAQRSGRVPAVALTGGTIAGDVYRAVAASPERSGVDWATVDFWWGDERLVAADSPERNAVQAREAFLDAVGAAPGRVYEVPSSDDTDPAGAADAYSATLRRHGSGAFDVVLLGLGPDGHIASLFPGYPQLDVDDRIAVAVEDSPKPPPARVSLTYRALNRTRAVWFIASGAGKAEAVAASLADGAEPARWPAVGVRGDDETVWLVDDAAAALLEEERLSQRLPPRDL